MGKNIHRFPLRVDKKSIHWKIEAIAFSADISINLCYTEAIKIGLATVGFEQMLKDRRKHVNDKRRASFLYVADGRTDTGGIAPKC